MLGVAKVIKEQCSCHVVSEGFGNEHANLILDEYADKLANTGKSTVTRVFLTVTALLKTHKRHNSVLDLPLAIPASRFISGEEIGWTLRCYWHMPCPQLAGILWSLRRSAKLSCNSVQLFLMKYGVIAVFVAAMIEADVVPVLTGVVAHLGYFKVGPALLAATAGAFAGDYLWFCAGIYYSQSIQNSRLYRRSVPETLIRRLGPWQIPASHLIYGTRISTMIFWGVQRISAVKFALIDGFGCVVLTGLLFTLGFGFSGSAFLVIGRVKQVERLMLLAIVSGLLLCLTSKVVRRLLREVPTGDRGAE